MNSGQSWGSILSQSAGMVGRDLLESSDFDFSASASYWCLIFFGSVLEIDMQAVNGCVWICLRSYHNELYIM